MANLIIKPTSGGSLILQDEGGDAAITVGATGNTTLAGTTNNLGTVTAGIIASGVTGGSGLDGGKVGSSAFLSTKSDSNWYSGLTADTVISFDDVTGGACFNIGGDYSTTNKRYDVPATGIYLFSFTIYTAQDDANNGFKICVNGASINQADNSARLLSLNEHGTGDHTQTFSVILSLTSGQYVDVRASITSDWYSGHSFWTGMRIT